MSSRLHVAIAAVSIAASACQSPESIDSRQSAIGQAVKSQLRGYDLGPPFPAGLRDSGLINGYAEGEWIPFVAVIEGRKLENSDGLAGDAGDGRYGATLIVPTYSPRNDANGISDLRVTGTYGQGDLTPIPNPFDDNWLIDNGYEPFVLGAYDDTGASDLQPQITGIFQKSGPTRFGGNVASAQVSIEFTAQAGATRVELLFAVRLAPPQLEAIAPNAASFPGTANGAANGAASFHPGPGPLFVGYHVGKPTGIATVPIKVDRSRCEDNADCPPGDYCGGGGECEEPCVNDSSCPADELCEDGVCQPPPPSCVDSEDCGDDVCVGGYCVPECPESCADPEFCDPDPCLPPDGTPPCILDTHCDDGLICEDGVCQPPEPPCDQSCPADDVCVDNTCVPPDRPCDDSGDCPGGELCLDGFCDPGTPPCVGPDCAPCTTTADCEGGYSCEDGVCVPTAPPETCIDTTDCPSGQSCEDGYCTPPNPPCGPMGECGPGELCETDTGTCVPEHPPLVCQNASDCPTDEFCRNGFCTPDPPDGCKNDNQCGGDDVCGGGWCEPPDRPCTDNSQCGGDYCIGGFCEPPHPPLPCTDSVDCPSGDACVGGYCEPPGGCSVDRDCPGGELCENGTCRPGQPPTPCEVSTDCPPTDDDVWVPVCYDGFCRPGGGDCQVDPDCPGGTVCADGVCVQAEPPTTCDDAYDCPGGHVCDGGVCQPGGDSVQCETADDCPPNPYDDVGPACVGGLCTTSRAAPQPCGATGSCAQGYSCQDDRCVPIAGACELTGDCADGESCLSGWCGVACSASSDCGTGVCALGRCAEPCTDYLGCSANEACLAGGCIALQAVVGSDGGNEDSWQVDVPTGDSSNVKGGCSSGGGTTGGLVVVLVAMALLWPRRRRSAGAITALVAVAAIGCSSDSPTPAGGVDAGGTVGDPAVPADAGAESSGDAAPGPRAPYGLVSCQDEPSPDAGPADDGDADAAEPESCCDPYGLCSGLQACIQGPNEQNRCRPMCDADAAEDSCGPGMRCVSFSGIDACIPASAEGNDCSPELCDAETICVGDSADTATCHRRCLSADDCDDGDICSDLFGSDTKACIAPAY